MKAVEASPTVERSHRRRSGDMMARPEKQRPRSVPRLLHLLMAIVVAAGVLYSPTLA